MIRSPFRRFVLISLAVIGFPSRGHPQTGDISHIEIIARPPSAKTLEAGLAVDPPSLEISDFKLRQQGAPIVIHVEKSVAVYPKHLLIVTAVALPTCPRFPSLRLLRSLLREGWTVRFADISGALTPPLLDAGALQSTCKRALPTANPLVPIQDLVKQPGRRIIVFMGLTNPDVEAEAIRKIPEVYSVDGGVRVSSHTPLFAIDPSPNSSSPQYGVRYVSCGFANSPNNICNMGVTNQFTQNGFSDGAMHEKSIASALKDVLSNNRYFDISFQLPSSTNAAKMPLELTIHYSYNLTVTIDGYSVQLGSNQEMVRMALRTQLQLVQRK